MVRRFGIRGWSLNGYSLTQVATGIILWLYDRIRYQMCVSRVMVYVASVATLPRQLSPEFKGENSHLSTATRGSVAFPSLVTVKTGSPESGGYKDSRHKCARPVQHAFLRNTQMDLLRVAHS